jgi:hypothetical protein
MPCIVYIIYRRRYIICLVLCKCYTYMPAESVCVHICRRYTHTFSRTHALTHLFSLCCIHYYGVLPSSSNPWTNMHDATGKSSDTPTCVCVFVCVRERKREKERVHIYIYIHTYTEREVHFVQDMLLSSLKTYYYEASRHATKRP